MVEPGALKTRTRKKSSKTALLDRKRAQRFPSWPGALCSNKGRIHSRRPTCHPHFSLATKRRTIHSGWPVTRVQSLEASIIGCDSSRVRNHGTHQTINNNRYVQEVA